MVIIFIIIILGLEQINFVCRVHVRDSWRKGVLIVKSKSHHITLERCVPSRRTLCQFIHISDHFIRYMRTEHV